MSSNKFATRLYLVILLLLPGYASLAHARDEGSMRNSAEYHILAAEVAGQRGYSDVAAREYLRALRIAPSLKLAERATQVAVYADDEKLAFEAASKWAEYEPERLEPRIVLMRVSMSMGQTSAATEHALFIAERHPDGLNAAFQDISKALTNNRADAESALAVMDGLAGEYGHMPELDYAKALLALRLEQYKVAEEAVSLALEEKDEWVEAVLLKATAVLRQGRAEEALALVNAADLSDEEQIGLHLAFARLLLEEEMAVAARSQYESVLAIDELHPEGLYAMGILQINLGNRDRAFQHFRKLYDEVGDQKDLAAYYLGGIEESRQNYEEALTWYELVAEGDRYLDAAQRKAFVLYRLGELGEARAWLASLRANQSEMAVQFYLAEGELLFEAEQLDEAMALYNQALEESPGELDLLYARSLIAERMGRLTLSERDLRSILKANPDDARSLNALGYILSNHTERYEEALDLIKRALEQTPDDAAVIDSMGWVHYRLGNLDKAHDYLSRAFEKMPDPEVAAHLGEVLWKMGEKEQAQQILEQALRDDPDHPTLRDTLKRLTQ